jgi:hypothetical protein
MLIHDADITGSFLYNGVNISNVTGSAASLTALNQFSASINLFTGSYNTGSFTGSFIGNGSGLNGVVSASFASTATSASQASNANTATSASQAANAVTSSYAANADLLDGIDSTRFAVTSSNTFTGTQYISAANNATSFTSTASIYTDGGFRVSKDAYVSGTIFVNNLTVYGTQSINYITSSQLNIGTNIITVNTDVPAIRFGGLAVYDSGSTGLTGSMLWDSEDNHWIYSNPSGSSYEGGMMISGPRNSSGLGNEQGTLNNVVMKGQGGDHITSSMITETGTATTFYTNALYVSSSNLVGIGTTSPDTLLTVNGTSGTKLFALVNASGGTRADFTVTENTGLILNVNEGATARSFNLQIAGTSQLFANSTGVGIGTTSPSAVLHTSITNTGNSIGAILANPNQSGTADSVSINFGLGRTVDGFLFTPAAITFGKEQQWTGTGSTVDGYLAFSTILNESTSERMRITSAGNVGIGTTSPGYKLDVNGEVAFSPNTAGKNTFIFSTNASNDARLLLKSDTTTKVDIQANGTSYFNGGNIGIGTTAPNRALTVASDTSFFTGASGAGAIDPGASELLTTGFNIAGQSSLDISNISVTLNKWKAIVRGGFANNNEGGGLTSSGLEIEVDSNSPSIPVGSSSITFSRNSSTGKLQVTYNAASNIRVTFVGTIQIINYPQSALPSVSKIILGNVGIGTTDPSTFAGGGLSLGTTSSGKNLILYSSNNGNNGLLQFIDLNGANALQIGGNAIDTYMYGYGNRPMMFSTNGIERIRITSGGETLLNTSSTGAGFVNTCKFGSYQQYTSDSNTTTLSTQRTAGLFAISGGDNSNNQGSYTAIVANVQVGASNNPGALFRGYQNTNLSIQINFNGNITNTNGSYGAISDISLKENIVDTTPKLDDLLNVKIRNYNLIGNSEKQIGVVAQELEEVFPKMIETNSEGLKSVKYSVFVPMLIKAIQEQQAQIEELKQLINK